MYLLVQWQRYLQSGCLQIQPIKEGVLDMNNDPLNKPAYSLNNQVVHNYFIERKPSFYEESEISYVYLTLFNEGIYPGKKPIMALLRATNSFLHRTSLRVEFKEIHNERLSNNELKKIIDDMGNALNEAIKKRDELKHKNGLVKLSQVAVVLNDAINYCMTCVVYRLQDLDKNQDKFYKIFNESDNELKRVIPSAIQQSALRPK